MKPLKYTVAALALIAVASFTQSAKAQNFGDLVFGVYDASTSGAVANSYEVDLGAFNTLTNGETFNLGTTVASTFAGDSSANLQFNIAGVGVSGTTSGLANDEVAFTASTLPPTLSGSNVTPTGDLKNEINEFPIPGVTLPSNSSSNGTGLLAGTLANSTLGSFDFEFIKGGSYGLAAGQTAITDLEGSFANGTTVGLYTDVNGSGTATEVGTFSISEVGGNEILTFDTLATPEPSAYALGLCAVALFFVLKRRSSVA